MLIHIRKQEGLTTIPRHNTYTTTRGEAFYLTLYPHWTEGLRKRGANPTHAGYLFQALLHEVACLLFSYLRVRDLILY